MAMIFWLGAAEGCDIWHASEPPLTYVDARGVTDRVLEAPEFGLSGFAQRFPIFLPPLPVENVSVSSGIRSSDKALCFIRLHPDLEVLSSKTDGEPSNPVCRRMTRSKLPAKPSFAPLRR